MIRRYITYTILIGLMVALLGCSDDSTGPDPSEAPQLPELQNEEAKMDVSFFKNTNPKALATASSATTQNYTDAKNTAIGASSTLLYGNTYQGFLSAAGQQQPNYNNGVWEWTYSYSYQGTSLEIRTTAEELNNKVEWAQYWTYDDSQGNSYNDYKIFEGTVSNDGSTGNWTFNVLDPNGTQEIPAIVSKYDITSDTQRELTAKFYDSSGSLTGTYKYVQDGAEHTLTISTVSSSSDVIVFWNTDTGAGYIQENGTKHEWDSNQQDI
ncbi:hypothetical protein LX73_2108 [Fodinibius salinus]|uniref:YD repeat-containing protein n=1 Tax=Fodinibius salinus TaxID=860790 RepID=A0A5D3YHE7_9BACT|nr:hypothetical protein [Fodinibius salinus]TYP92744.1 hypothetical protein LX73_2108 [Fodinibius salinus]